MNLKILSSLLIASNALAPYAMASSFPLDTQARVQATLTGAIAASVQGHQQATLMPSTDPAANMRRVLSGQNIDFAAAHPVAAAPLRAVAVAMSASQVQRVLLGHAG